MFVGEGICIFLFIWYKSARKQDYEEEVQAQIALGKKKPNIFLIILPALSDACTSTLQHVALVFVSASIYQMMRGGTIAIIAMGSVIFLKRVLKKYQILGCVVVIGGIVIIGISALIYGSNNDSSQLSQIISIVMLLVSLFTSATTYLLEEYLLRKYYLHPFQLVGWEGIWGFSIYMVVFMPFLQFLHCGLDMQNCVFSKDGNPNFERVQQYFIEMVQSPLLFIMCVLGVFSISAFNVIGVSVTKYISSLTRSVVDQVRTILIWVFSIIITVTNCCGVWENTNLGPILFELVGFCILLFGQVTYNGIIKLPWFEYPKDPMSVQQIEAEPDQQRAKVMGQSFGEANKNDNQNYLLTQNGDDDDQEN
ncbi:hypothetical protein PPERSA_10726 [Pseudocohnilembus persalinus]|uniref:Nucleotide-sugar transporter n=1 Tax=Pseudocohnilembus persalinus TaxID=266149 RepID=A0A0V0QDE3_PSEPJ|nr:hypothetical protein PPERSA_10726 [Pseudocohnilembus persalinus]|eukprot:KRX00227.1 hypothetical protein PPERSA_10726 [Pseudocohnilembus persalinus]